jgi:hypothetical protein
MWRKERTVNKQRGLCTLLSIFFFIAVFHNYYSDGTWKIGNAYADDYEDYTHRLSQSNGSYSFWTTPPSERVFKDSPVPATIGSTVKVYAAKNEFEPFQVVVKPASSGNVTVTIGNFGSGIQAEIYQVKYVNVITATDSLGKTGPYPDPLWPLENGASVALTANENTAFWFSVSVPPTTAAGDYTAQVTIGGVSIPVTLHVFNFQVPAELHVESKMNYSDNRILTKYGVTGTGANYWFYVDKIKQYFIDHRLTSRSVLWSGGLTTDYAEPYIDYNCTTATFTDNDGIWGFDKPAERYLSGTGLMNGTFTQPFNGGVGFPSFQVATFHDNDPSNDQRPTTFCGLTRTAADWYTNDNPNSAYNLKWWQYITSIRNYLQTRGYLSRAYYYFANEPQDQADYDAVAWYSRYLKAAAPDMKLMVSENPRPEIFTHTNYLTDRQVDIWVPVLHQYDPVVSHEREKNHGEVSWLYFLYGTRPPFFNPITLDHPGIESKFTGWFLWKYRVKGIAYYQLNEWSQNPWTADPRAGTAQNGDTFMLYPPAPTGDGTITYGANNHRMVPSIRFELMRDSLEDYEYLYLLNGGAQPQVDLTNAADTQADKIITSTTSYTRDSVFMYNLRRLIGRKLGGEIAVIPDIRPPATHPRSQGNPGNYYINFQDPSGSPTTSSTETDPVTGAVYRYFAYNGRNYFQIGSADYDDAAGYGWYAPPEVHWMTAWLSSGPNPLQRSILYSDYGRRATFEFDLPNGRYNITASVGWQGGTYSHNYIDVEGVNFVNDEATTPSAPYIVRTKEVTISDGKLTMVMGAIENDEYTMLNYLDIETLTRLLSCTISGTGSGSVSSATPGETFSCTSGVCDKAIDSGASLTLYPSPSSGSEFSAWGGACSGTGNCALTMDTDRTVSAQFSFCPARIGVTCFATLTSALNVALNNDELRTMTYPFAENPSFERGLDVVLKGGYNNYYEEGSRENSTTVLGPFTIKNGSVVVDRIEIR